MAAWRSHEDYVKLGAKGQMATGVSSVRSFSNAYEMAPISITNEPNDMIATRTRAAEGRGAPTSLSLFNTLDLIAVLVSLLALALSIVTISPSLPYAARLQYPEQIVIIGFLLGIMNQCLSRVLPWFSLVLERQIGSSSLQNFDGLLRWSPFSSHLHAAWRLLILMSLALPLALSVLYKRYTGGVGHETLADLDTYFSPVALPGLDKNVPGLSIMANATQQFLADAKEGLHVAANTQKARYYGYNLISISNSSAAALDIPVPGTFRRLQGELNPGEVYYLNTSARGTVASWSASFDNTRTNNALWNNYTSSASLQEADNYMGSQFGMLSIGTATVNDAWAWDNSWIFLGEFTVGSDTSEDAKLKAFRKTAQMFKVRRHDCVASLKITRSSVQLFGGECSEDPLPWQYQYYENCELALGQFFFPMLQQIFDSAFKKSSLNFNRARQLVPIYTTTVASLYQSRFAMMDGVIPIQSEGPIFQYWAEKSDPEGPGIAYPSASLNETYLRRGNSLVKTTPTLRSDGTLYLVLAVQPVLVLIAFFVPFIVTWISRRSHHEREMVLPRNFNFVEVLAGVDHDSLKAFSGESSGKTSKQVKLELQIDHYHQRTSESDTTLDGGHQGLSRNNPKFLRRNSQRIRYILKPRMRKHRSSQQVARLLTRDHGSQSDQRALFGEPTVMRSPSPSEGWPLR